MNDADYTDRRYISIHAPAKGATTSANLPEPLDTISIHAPAKGATAIDEGFADELMISIHAPAKGATGY